VVQSSPRDADDFPAVTTIQWTPGARSNSRDKDNDSRSTHSTPPPPPCIVKRFPPNSRWARSHAGPITPRLLILTLPRLEDSLRYSKGSAASSCTCLTLRAIGTALLISRSDKPLGIWERLEKSATPPSAPVISATGPFVTRIPDRLSTGQHRNPRVLSGIGVVGFDETVFVGVRSGLLLRLERVLGGLD